MSEYIIKRLMEHHRDYLSEMATPWKDIRKGLGEAKTKEILIHLIKLYYWSNFDRVNKGHWIEEIYAFYHDIPKQKSDNKYPSAGKIYNAIWESWGDTFDSIQYALNTETKYGEFPRIKIDEVAIEFCSDYIRWLSERLSKNGTITLSEVVTKINGLSDDYDLTLEETV